jgi:nucleotide-binding universal stress UspA family protein
MPEKASPSVRGNARTRELRLDLAGLPTADSVGGEPVDAGVAGPSTYEPHHIREGNAMNTPVVTGPIVVGFASTPEGHAALRHAGHEALLRKLSLLVVDLSKDNHDATPAAIGADLADLRAGFAAAGLAIDIAPPDALFEPSEHLLKVTQEADATLIVIGLRHRTRVGKFLLGSSAQRILLEADCPVLTVKSGADTRHTQGS